MYVVSGWAMSSASRDIQSSVSTVLLFPSSIESHLLVLTDLYHPKPRTQLNARVLCVWPSPLPMPVMPLVAGPADPVGN